MLESARDPYSAPWWTESRFGGSPRRNGSFPTFNYNLSRLKEADDRSSELDDGARKKLTWISREDRRLSIARNSAGNDQSSIQNGSVHGRLAGFGVTDSPGRVIHNPTESPLRKGESVRRIRIPSVDFDMTEGPSSTTGSHRHRSLNHAPRSASFKEGSADAVSEVAQSDHNGVREASSIRRIITSTAAAHDQRTAPKKKGLHVTADDSPTIFTPILDSPESDRMVVSYLAEETDRIIKGRLQKLKLRGHFDQLRTTDHGRSSAGEATRTTNGSGWRPPPSSSSRHVDKTTAERVLNTIDDMHRDQVCVGDQNLDDESDDSHASSMPGSPSLPISPLLPVLNNTLSTVGKGIAPPNQTISATMKNYLDNRRRGSNMGPQIILPHRPEGPTLSPDVEHLNLAVLRRANQPQNPSPLSKIKGLARHDSFTPSSRAALSPLNGNEDVTYSATSLSQSKEDYSTGGELLVADKDPTILCKRTKDSQKISKRCTESVQEMQQEGENGFPSRSQYWADFLGNGAKIDSRGSLRHIFQESEERTSPSGRKELGMKIAPVRFHSNGARGEGHSPHQAGKPIGGSARHSAPSRGLIGQSQRYEPDVGRSLLSDKVLGAGSRDKRNGSRRWQSCRRDSIINSLLDSSERNEAYLPASRSKPAALPSGHDTSSGSKSSRRSSVDMHLSSSSDTLPDPSTFLCQTEKQKYIFKAPSDCKSSPRTFSVAGPPESGGNTLSSSKTFSVPGPESSGNPLSSSRRISMAGHESPCGKPLSRSWRYSGTAGLESGRSPVVSYSEPLQRPKSPILTRTGKAKHQQVDSSFQTKTRGPHMNSPYRDPQLSEKKKNALQLERSKMSHKNSGSLDQQDIFYKRLFVQTKKDNRSGQPITTSTSVSQACSTPSPKTKAKPQTPSSPGSSIQRWLANQFKGSKARSSSVGKDRDSQEESKPRKKSPWRTRSAEIFQVITGRKGRSTRHPAVPLFDANGPQNLRQGNSFDSDSSQSSMNAPDPWHHQMMHTESGRNSTPHRNAYVLPTLSPSRSKGLQSLFEDR